jgi:hypothetical protein
VKPSPTGTNSFRAVSLVAGFVLISAALLKAEHALGSSGGITGWHTRTLALLAIEAGLGLLLLLRPWLWPVQLAALLTFAVFACVASYKALLGLPSCGCFGKVNVPPIVTASFDVMVVVALAWLPPNDRRRMLRRIGVGIAGITLVALSTMVVGKNWIRASAFTTLGQSSSPTAARGIVLLEPDQWIGKRLAILDYIDIADRLRSGAWTLVLYHHDCSACIAAIPGYEQMARDEHGKTAQSHVALIEMPPYAAAGENAVSASSLCMLGKLSDKREWFATTPVVIELRDAIVTQANDGNAAHAQLRPAP